MVKKRDLNGRPNLNALFIYNMPIRALAKNAGQFISMGVVDALVLMIKGWIWACLLLGLVTWFLWHNIILSVVVCFVCWILPLLFELIKNLILNAIGEARLRSQERGN